MPDRDPLDRLRLALTPLAPDPAFAARLRQRLAAALEPTPSEEEPMTDVLSRDELSRHGTRPGDVSYITLGVPDLDRARAFYGTVLGWRFSPGTIENGAQVDTVIPAVGLWGGAQPSGAVLGYRVDDIGAAVARVRDLGGTATEPRDEPYGLAADCVDDQGVAFYLHQLPAAGRPAPPNGHQPGDISYITLAVPDPARAAAFYGEAVGWSGPPNRTEHGFQVDSATPMIGIGPAGPGRPAGVVLAYLVSDIAAAVDRIRAAGGTATDPVQRPYGLESDCTDDQGIAFYLHEFPG